jgi:RNase P/RNase MRP subunit POP5
MRIRRPPSMREKKRYVVFSVMHGSRLGFEQVRGAVMDSALGWMGEKGISASGMKMIRNLWDPERMQGWISCTPKAVDDVKLSLALVHQIGDANVILRTISVTGTIRAGGGNAKKGKVEVRSLASSADEAGGTKGRRK